MKNLTIGILFISTLLIGSCATMVQVQMEQKTQTIQVEQSKDELYIKANNWMVENFNNAKSVIQFSDKEAGVITGKYLMKSILKYSNVMDKNSAYHDDIFAIIKILVKDGATKITINSPNYSYDSYNGKFPKEEAVNQIDVLMISFKDYMTNFNETF